MSQRTNQHLRGHFLVSEPFLPDPNFERTVVALCEHNGQGAFGFVLNRPAGVTLYQVLAGQQDHSPAFLVAAENFPVYVGGPVEVNTLHYVYRWNGPSPVEESVEVVEGLYWGGRFEQLKTLMADRRLEATDVRLFAGYSGWGAGQLEHEIAESSWITTPVRADFVFAGQHAGLWRQVLLSMGGRYRSLANYPRDPRLN